MKTNNNIKQTSYLIYIGNRSCIDLNRITGILENNDKQTVKLYYAVGDKEEALSIPVADFDKYLTPYINSITNNTK